LLRFDLPAFFGSHQLTDQVLALCKKNGHSRLARVRLVIFRGAGGLFDPADHFPNYIIESWSLPMGSGELNQNGLIIDIFPDGRKSCDPYSNIKSNNFLLYALAALHAKGNRFNDCLVLNSHGRIADSSIANLFYCKGGKIFTPPLSEGCVAGVMRRYLLERLPETGFSVEEKETSTEDLEGAEEIFLTNAIRGVNWVQGFRNSTYGHTLTHSVYDSVVKTL
jgi:branched-chain amino acid aminotransferase